MSQTVVLEITLSEEALEFVRSKVAAGEYRSESEVLASSIDVLMEEDEECRRFEQEEVIPSHDEFMANPSSAIPLEQVRHNLESARRQRLKAS